MVKNEKYSYKDFMHKSFKDQPVEDFNNTEIIGTCFYQECDVDDPVVEKDIFPDNIVGITFRNCNLDNVYIPPGNTVENNCSYRKLKTQNNLMDWILDNDLKPVEPTSKEDFIILGLSIDPKDIPTEKMSVSIIRQKEEELRALEG